MRTLTILIGFVLSSLLLHAQKNYAVMVTDTKNGNPIAGASVIIKSTGKKVVTSGSGNVVIFASSNDSLQVKFKGYKDREIGLEGQAVAISIEMVSIPKKVPIAPRAKKKLKLVKRNKGSTSGNDIE